MLTHYQSFLIAHVKQSIQDAQQNLSKLDPKILNLEGLSSNKIRHFLNNVCLLQDGKYLEIGIWKGSTFISALYQNNLKYAVAIDNWSQFGQAQQEFKNNIDTFISPSSYIFYETDCFKFDVKTLQDKINIYFYDAGHTFQDQRQAFVHYNEIFEDTFIAIVDNYNWIQVQQATQQAFKELQYTILFEEFLHSPTKKDALHWWTGLYVAVLCKIKRTP